MYNIPLFKLNFDEAEAKAALATIESKWISSGPKCIELEEKFSKMLDVKYALGLSSCTAALHLAILAAGIGSGDEVLVPSLTFVATVNCVKYTGATPVFCDVEGKEQITIDPKDIEKKITKNTKAIIPMHFAGFAANMDAIMKIANKYGLKVIEDACHGPLSEYHGQKLGTIGDVGCFSFFSNKNISTGEGGILVTNNQDMFEKAKLLRSHGMTTMSYDRSQGHSTTYDVIELGYNYRLDDIRSSIGIVQLDKLRTDISKRKVVRNTYIKYLSSVDKIIIPFEKYEEISSSYIFPVVLSDGNATKRDAMRKYLSNRGIQTSVHYPPAHRFKIYQSYVTSELPNTEYVADCEFTLPMYGDLTKDDIKYICDTVISGIRETC